MGTFPIIMLAVLSGILNGSYAVPIKVTGKWAWENIWLWFAVSGLLIVPWIFALAFIPDVGKELGASPVEATTLTFLCGLGWGIGAVAFGLALHLIGFSLGYTLMMGLIAVIGALVPMLVKNPSALLTPGGMIILLALAVTILGIVLCGSAGKAREGDNQEKTGQSSKDKQKFTKGIILCFVSGLFSSMINFAFEFGIPLKMVAMDQLGEGTNAFHATSIIWAIALTGGFVVFLVYSLYLLFRNKTTHNFSTKGTRHYFLWTLLMGIVFYSSLMCYGLAASALGDAGTTTGVVDFYLWGYRYGQCLGIGHLEMG